MLILLHKSRDQFSFMKKVLDLMSSRKSARQKSFALLIDPDGADPSKASSLIRRAEAHSVNYLFIGGSLVIDNQVDELILRIKDLTDIPVVLFPGSVLQVSPHADAVFFLSLISGRNPELLIGHHVLAAPLIKKMGLEVIPTGYMLVDSGKPTTASYVSHTQPLPHDKPDIAKCTAMAGEMLGLQVIYMDGGSGAQHPITPEMVYAVSGGINIPLIVGGGIRDKSTALQILNAGADIIVVGNALEHNPTSSLLEELTDAVAECSM
jgi:putative glycerol-1-phosphate prenyltransferase